MNHLKPLKVEAHGHAPEEEKPVGKKKKKTEGNLKLESMVGKVMTEAQFDEAAGKKDACYHKVKARYDVWPSAYASGALVKCRKVGAANWGNKSKKKEGVNEKMRPAVKKLLKQKGYAPIFQAIDNSKRQFKQMRYSRGEIQDTLIDMFGDEDPKILKKIKESVKEGLGDRISKISKRYAKGQKKSKKALKNKKGPYQEGLDEKRGTCWVGYKQVGMKDKGGRKVPNCVKEITEIYYEENGKGHGYTFEHIKDLSLTEAEYQGRKVKLGKIMQGDTKKFKVYVKNPKGNVVKVNFGHGGSSAKGKTMKIRKSNPAARKSFRARHNCDNPGPRHKARYWSCRKW